MNIYEGNNWIIVFVDKKKYNEFFNNKEMVEAIKYCNKVLDYMN